jgi:hypothetical protein
LLIVFFTSYHLLVADRADECAIGRTFALNTNADAVADGRASEF